MVTKQVPKLPRIGLFACFSGASNTGSLTGLAALEVVRRLGSETVGICSLPAILNQIPRQTALVKKIEKIVVVDGCHNGCALQLLANVGIRPEVYVNLEKDLNLRKLGPFTSLSTQREEIESIADALVQVIENAIS